MSDIIKLGSTTIKLPDACIPAEMTKVGGEKKIAEVRILRAESDEGPWEIIPVSEHPAMIKDVDVLGQMLNGFIAHGPGDIVRYRAERVGV